MPDTTDARPAAFDKRLLDHMPLIRRVASFCSSNREQTEELVQDTLASALAGWKSFRPDGSFYMWLTFKVRSIATERRRAADRRKPHMRMVSDDALQAVGTRATQMDAMNLADVLSSMPAGREGDILLRRAMGDTLKAIGNDHGITKARVQQIEFRAREVLARRTGQVAA